MTSAGQAPRARTIDRVVAGRATSDGAGVRLKRSLGLPTLDYLDPFLLLDEFRSDESTDYIAGFPDHPHRGFETVTYMLAGRMRHEDHMGNQGDLGPGSVQWMTAGRGIIHSEMPQQEQGLMWGFQMWVNLPRSHKMCEPRYQDIPPEQIPEVALEAGGKVRVVAGRVGDTDGAVTEIAVQPLYLHVELPAGQTWEQPVPGSHNGFVYVFEGELLVGPASSETEVSTASLGVMGQGDTVRVRTGDQPAGFLLVAGRPLNEPVVRYGPFVMSTRDEIIQAFREMENGTFLKAR